METGKAHLSEHLLVTAPHPPSTLFAYIVLNRGEKAIPNKNDSEKMSLVSLEVHRTFSIKSDEDASTAEVSFGRIHPEHRRPTQNFSKERSPEHQHQAD
jgi:hypothetical protein